MPFLSMVTLTFDLDIHTRPSDGLPCEFGANPISGSRDISYKKSQTAPKTEPYAVHCVR